MVERICAVCHEGNPLENRFCGKCGNALERLLPAAPVDAPLVVAGRQLPVTWKQVGRTVAVGAVALAAEVGLSVLRRRLNGAVAPLSLARHVKGTIAAAGASESQATGAPGAVTIISERVIELIESERGRKIIDKHIWRKIGD